MALKFERKLPLVMAFVFLMLAAIGFVFYQSTVSAQEALRWQRHSQDVIYRLDEILYLTLDSEASVRGFVNVGSDTYLEPHRIAERRIKEDLSYLRQRFNNYAPQIEELDRLEANASEYLFEANRRVQIRIDQPFEVAVLEISPQKVKPVMDAMRVSVEKLKASENDLLDRRKKNLDNSLYQTIWLLIIASFAGAAALVIANFMIFREIGRRRSAETALVESNRTLEGKVTERTEALEQANTVLVEIGSEREELLVKEQEARKEAEIANRLRDEFMATVSHELRTPLNSILGWARLMQDGGLDDSQNAKAVSTIIRSSETQNRLIEDLLDVARLISGKLQLEHEEVDLPAVVEHSAESLRPLATKKNVEIVFIEDRPDDNCKIIGDRNRLVQVFSNVLENAIKFSEDGGRIEVSILSCDPHALVKIRDFGAGISSDFLPQVFERFRQDTSGDHKKGGLGLGLAIVRNLVEIHGGSVAVASEGEGKGAEFTITLPLIRLRTADPANDLSDSVEQSVRNDVG
jgi:Osmosensitive K+ channel histidine kinase